MDILHNKVKAALREGQNLIGGWCLSGSAVAVEAMGYVGYDYLVIDLEHSPTATQDVVPLLQAAETSQTPAIVRMASHDKIHIKHALDLGANSLYFPFVQNVAEARAIAQACSYPPHGTRGYARMHRAGRYLSIPDYFERARDELLIVAQLETPEALAGALDIGAVDGIDALFVGPGDLSVAMGLPGQISHPEVQAAMADVARQCQDHNICLGTVMSNAEQAAWALNAGYRFVSIGNELAAMIGGARTALEQARALGKTG